MSLDSFVTADGAEIGRARALQAAAAGLDADVRMNPALNDEFQRSFLTEVAEMAGREFKVAPDTTFASVREAALDRLADLVAEHLDTAAPDGFIVGGPPPGLPVLPPGHLAGRQASAGT